MNAISKTLTAGLTFTERVRSTVYLPPVWALRLMLRGAAPLVVDSAPLDTGEHLLQASATATLLWPAGEYVYSLRALSGAEVIEIEAGRLTVAPAFENIVDGTDVRQQAEITLANIEAVLQKRATTDQQRYTIGTRELWRTPIPELLQLRSHYRAEVRRLRAKDLGLSALGSTIRPLL